VARELRLALINQGVRVDSPSESVLAANEIPQVVLTVSQDQRQRVVVGQTSAGQVRELELRALFTFNLTNAAGREVIPSTSLTLTRSLNFSETAVLAKDAEEAQLFNDMQNDMVAQVMRRLSTVRQF
jgi:LPS-assembly lipoprotein